MNILHRGLVLIVLALAACHSRHPPPPQYPVGGTVTGLTASGLVLRNEGADDLTVAVNASTFQFATRVVAGGSYSVQVAAQPMGETCTVADGSGSNLRAPVGNVSVQCSPDTYVISGTITGLTANGLVLQDNGADDLPVPAGSNSFQFATRIAAGGAYDVRISAQPAGATCTITHGSGSNLGATVNNISIACSTVTHTIGGTVAGLNVSGLVLQNNGGDDLTVGANATAFQFATPIAAGGAYAVTVAAQPVGLLCSVGNGTGAALNTDVTNVQVMCSTSTFQVGGSVTGLTGNGLVLQNNAGDDLTVSTGAASFLFTTPVAYGSSYAVTVLTQPSGQVCTVSDGAGTITRTVSDVTVNCANIPTYSVTPSADANGTISPSTPQIVNTGASVVFTATPSAGYAVSQWLVDGTLVQTGGSVYSLSNVTANHTVQVTFATTTLTLSVGSLALAVNNPGLDASLTGNPREILVTNTGFIAATNLAISGSALPSGTATSTSCGGSLAPGGSCVITVTPGSSASSNCDSGSVPTPGSITVSADNSNTMQASLLVLSFGCLHESGYIYTVDDTTPTTSSIGGAVASQADAANAAWSSVGITTNATSDTDGAANTQQIVSVLGAGSTYAAQICTAASAGGYSDWYLPAKDELSSVYQHLATAGVGSFSGIYWSSTESTAAPAAIASGQSLTSGTGNQFDITKSMILAVRCVRQMN